MRSRIAVIVSGSGLAALVMGQPLAAQQNGTVTFTTRNGQTMVEYINGSRIRIESGKEIGGTFIMDVSTGMLTVLMPDRRMYLQWNGVPTGTGAQGPATQWTVTQGGTETIAGAPCTDYTISGTDPTTGKAGTGMVCATTGLGVVNPYAVASGPMAQWLANNPSSAALMQVFQSIPGKAVLKAAGLDGNINDVDVLVTKLDPSPLSTALFQVPPGYSQVPPAMLGAMGGGTH